MKYRHYGKNGPEVSCLGYGVMRLPGYRGRVNFSESHRIMRAAMESGVNLFDSHHNYQGGDSEIAIGKALKGWKGQRIYVQTKTPWYRDEPRKFFEKLLYEALEKMGVDCIDYFLHHAMNMEMWKEKGKDFIKFTDWALSKGLIAHRGFSSHDKPENIKQFIDTGYFDCMLVSYNWLNPGAKSAITHGARKGMGVGVMNPVGGGTLSSPSRHVMRVLPGAKTPAELALRYVMATPGISVAFSGMSDMKQVKENVKLASRRTYLTPKQAKTFKAGTKALVKKTKDYCTACGYCMPCKHEVDIPGNFRLMNQAVFFGAVGWAKYYYAEAQNHKDGDRSAAACRQCGECLPKCPNKIPIIAQLKATQRKLSRKPKPAKRKK